MTTLEDDEAEQKLINEEYKTWKKNSPFLYDLILSSALEWPSLTVEWLPDKKIIKDNKIDYSEQRLILGTHTNDTETNHLLFAKCKLPTIDPIKLQETYNQSSDIYGGFGGAAGKIEIIQKIIHDGEVNRARYMPQNMNIIATKTKHADVYVFDRQRHSSKPQKGGICEPQLICKGHHKEGYGLDWNRFKEGVFISGADDHLICQWDIRTLTPVTQSNSNKNKNANNNSSSKLKRRRFTKHKQDINCCAIYKQHKNRVEDVEWHKKHANLFASVSDDKSLMIWDTTASNNKPIKHVPLAHKNEVNCVSWSPHCEYLLLTGGADKFVNLWDIRNMSQKLHCMEAHAKSLYQVQWSPHSEVHFASAGADRRIMIWDLSLIGQEQTAEDAHDGPPELLFVHGGHTDKVSDFSWNENDPWVISSVADNNIIQIWQMTEEVLTNEDLTQHVRLE